MIPELLRAGRIASRICVNDAEITGHILDGTYGKAIRLGRRKYIVKCIERSLVNDLSLSWDTGVMYESCDAYPRPQPAGIAHREQLPQG